jgi:peptidoglycan/xylan/chitin deacetylase (PgdA/CDA1 family)
VTFDDGYRDVYEHAFPLLKRKGIPAAVFVVTDLVGTPRLQRHDRVHLAVGRVLDGAGAGDHLVRILSGLGLQRPGQEDVDGRSGAFAAVRVLLETLSAAELERVLEALGDGGAELADHPELWPLTWEMVAEMNGAGITIGSHTRSHYLLAQESRERARQQLSASRAVLENRLGATVRHFAYPDGSFNGAVVEEVAAAGYRYGYTTCRHRDLRHPLLTVPRRMLWENASRGRTGHFSAAVMQCEVRGVFDFANRCRQDHGPRERAGWAQSA